MTQPELPLPVHLTLLAVCAYLVFIAQHFSLATYVLIAVALVTKPRTSPHENS